MAAYIPQKPVFECTVTTSNGETFEGMCAEADGIYAGDYHVVASIGALPKSVRDGMTEENKRAMEVHFIIPKEHVTVHYERVIGGGAE